MDDAWRQVHDGTPFQLGMCELRVIDHGGLLAM
jgi:hypothetical protein